MNVFEKRDDDSPTKIINKVEHNIMQRNTVRVENYKGVVEYMCDDADDFERSIKLSRYLKKELTQIFGKHNTRFKGEFFYYLWIIEYDGEIFQISTANRKGTQYSIVGNHEDDKSKVCMNFLKRIEELLDEAENF